MIFGVCKTGCYLVKKKENHEFITENTIINVNEGAFELRAKEFICESFVKHVNELYGTSVIELKLKSHEKECGSERDKKLCR